MKLLKFALVLVVGLIGVVPGVQAGIGTWGGLPPEPNVLIIQFKIDAAQPNFAPLATSARSMLSEYVSKGEVCEYRESNMRVADDSPPFAKITVAFKHPKAFKEAYQAFAGFDSSEVEVLSNISMKCYRLNPVQDPR